MKKPKIKINDLESFFLDDVLKKVKKRKEKQDLKALDKKKRNKK